MVNCISSSNFDHLFSIIIVGISNSFILQFIIYVVQIEYINIYREIRL